MKPGQIALMVIFVGALVLSVVLFWLTVPKHGHSGSTASRAFSNPGSSPFSDGPSVPVAVPPADVPPQADVALRLRSFLRDALDGPEERALLVAHDAVVMLVLYVLLPMGETELLDFATDHTVLNASVTHLTRAEDGWKLATFSDVAHLRREGADVTAHPGSPDVEPR